MNFGIEGSRVTRGEEHHTHPPTLLRCMRLCECMREHVCACVHVSSLLPLPRLPFLSLKNLVRVYLGSLSALLPQVGSLSALLPLLELPFPFGTSTSCERKKQGLLARELYTCQICRASTSHQPILSTAR